MSSQMTALECLESHKQLKLGCKKHPQKAFSLIKETQMIRNEGFKEVSISEHQLILVCLMVALFHNLLETWFIISFYHSHSFEEHD